MPSYVIVTETGREPGVVASLADAAIAAFCPIERRKAFGERRTTVRERPLFPRYVFIATSDLTRDFECIRHRTPHVVAFLGQNDTPQPISETWLERMLLLQMLGAFDYAQEHKPTLRIGQLVRIVAGQFHDYLGTVTAIRGDRVVLDAARGGRLMAPIEALRAA